MQQEVGYAFDKPQISRLLIYFDKFLNLSKSIKSTLKGRFVFTVLKLVFTSLINQVLNDLILVENQR